MIITKTLVLFFEFTAGRVIDNPFFFDGVANLTVRRRKKRQLVFNGEMHTNKNKDWWLEDFSVTVTDKRITKQGVWIKIRVGDVMAEGDIFKVYQ